MSAASLKTNTRTDQQLAKLNKHVSNVSDCWHELNNNLRRGEMEFAGMNARALFQSASSITRLRRSIMAATQPKKKGLK